MGVRSWVYGWFWRGWKDSRHGTAVSLHEYEEEQFFKGDVKLTIKGATNGRLLSMQLFKPIPGPGNDWETTLYLVPEGTSLVETITRALVAAKVRE